MEKIRLQKYFTDCGVLSRRAAEKEIEAGHVKVNGIVASLGDKVEPGKDKVVWNGRGVVLKRGEPKTVIALNKPRGYVCTMSDEKGRKQVTELVADAGKRLYPIGRLDMASEGLLLLTDDGEFANLLMHPRHHVPKLYRVSVSGKLDQKALELLRSPLEIDGSPIMPVEVGVLDSNADGGHLEMVLLEGRNRQIRKMCDCVGLKITRLCRVALGDIKLGSLPVGKWRRLSKDELLYLDKSLKTSIDKDMKG